jgi:nucleoside-diphosphate-sugar epimerase
VTTKGERSWLGKRALVTGDAGFIGSHVIDRLPARERCGITRALSSAHARSTDAELLSLTWHEKGFSG